MNKKQILADLDRLRREVEKPEPNLKDVMEKLEGIERRLSGIESRPTYIPLPQYPVYPHYRQPTVWYGSITSGTCSLSGGMGPTGATVNA